MKTFVAFLFFSGFAVYVLCTNNFSGSIVYVGSKCVTPEGRSGICRTNCSILSLEQSKGASSSCGFKNEEMIVCCPETSYPTLAKACAYRTRKQKLRNDYVELIEKMAKDEQNWGLKAALTVRYKLDDAETKLFDDCVAEADSIGGNEGKYYKDWCRTLLITFSTYAGEDDFAFTQYNYPHVALLGWKNSNQSISWNCAATLVHKSFVLTTAHCIFKYGKPPDLARISEQRLTRRGNDKFAIDYDVEKIITHESYDSSNLYNDIALLKIKLKRDLGDKVPPMPICIWTRNDYPTTIFKSLGYGSPSYGLSHVLSLRDSNATLVSNVECSKSYNSNAMLPNGLRGSQMCASDPTRVVGGCKGDSGGPLQFIGMDETPYLVGIASFGLQCRGSKPGIYARVYSFLDWIENKMSENLL